MTTWDRRGTDDIGSPGIFFVFEKVENNQSHVDLLVLFSPIHDLEEEFRHNQLLISVNCCLGGTQRTFPVKYMFR